MLLRRMCVMAMLFAGVLSHGTPVTSNTVRQIIVFPNPCALHSTVIVRITADADASTPEANGAELDWGSKAASGCPQIVSDGTRTTVKTLCNDDTGESCSLMQRSRELYYRVRATDIGQIPIPSEHVSYYGVRQLAKPVLLHVCEPSCDTVDQRTSPTALWVDKSPEVAKLLRDIVHLRCQRSGSADVAAVRYVLRLDDTGSTFSQALKLAEAGVSAIVSPCSFTEGVGTLKEVDIIGDRDGSCSVKRYEQSIETVGLADADQDVVDCAPIVKLTIPLAATSESDPNAIPGAFDSASQLLAGPLHDNPFITVWVAITN